MIGHDILGWGAALLTLLTFLGGDMLRLRALALVANGAFISYGFTAGIAPVLALHLALAPVNLWRLAQLWCLMRRRAADATATAPSLPAAAVAADAGSAVPGRLATGPHLTGCASPLRRARPADPGTACRRASRAGSSFALTAGPCRRPLASAARPVLRRVEGRRR